VSAGQEFAAEIARYLRINSRSRRRRGGVDLVARILEIVEEASWYGPGYYSEAMEAKLRPAIAAVAGYRKHVQGYRVRGEVAYAISLMGPLEFARMLGQQIDAGVENVGQAEEFYREFGRRVAA
jgi:hypothetical protein